MKISVYVNSSTIRCHKSDAVSGNYRSALRSHDKYIAGGYLQSAILRYLLRAISYYLSLLATVMILLVSASTVNSLYADADTAYQELQQWIQAHRPVPPVGGGEAAKARYALACERFNQQLRNCYQRFVQTYPRARCSARIYFKLGRMLWDASCYASLIPLYQKFLQYFPRSLYRNAVQYDLLRALLKCGRLAEAKQKLKFWLSQDMHRPELLRIQRMITTREQLRVGQPVPEIKARSIVDEAVSLHALRGRVLLLEFWATWCGPCRWQLPMLKKLYHQYHEQGFLIIGISLDYQRTRLVGFVQQEQLPWLHILDQDKRIAQLWGLRDIPHLYLIDRRGIIRAIDPDKERLLELLPRLLKAK